MTEEDKHLTPEQADARLSVMGAVVALIESKNIDLLSAEDFLEVLKEVCLFGRSFFSEEFWSTRYRNKEIVVGETDTSPISTPTSGTVVSKSYNLFRKHAYPANAVLQDWLEELFAVAKSLQEALKNGDKTPNLVISDSQRRELDYRTKKVFDDWGYDPSSDYHWIKTTNGWRYDSKALPPVKEQVLQKKSVSQKSSEENSPSSGNSREWKIRNARRRIRSKAGRKSAAEKSASSTRSGT